jgi:hypothetical protein
MRRTLLSSIPGAAVTSIRVAGALHEFTTLEGVKEDLTDIVLNIILHYFGHSSSDCSMCSRSLLSRIPLANVRRAVLFLLRHLTHRVSLRSLLSALPALAQTSSETSFIDSNFASHLVIQVTV